MNHATILFVRKSWNPVSWIIRWALPVSRFKLARSSHSMILDGDHVIHATMLHGVVRQPINEVFRDQSLVARKEYEVPDLQAGLDWARKQIGKKYDFKGAFGLSLEPDRQWQEDDKWFCHELSASFIHNAGRHIFGECGHVTDSHLLMVR